MEDLKVTGYGDEYGDGGIYCCKLNIDGSSQDFMFWIDAKEDPDVWYGWYADAEGENYVGDKVELAPGEGLWFNSPNPEFKVVSAGQVGTEKTVVTLVYGNQLCPNPTPMTLKMENCWMDGYGDEYGDGGIYCCKLNIDGSSQDFMFWIDAKEDPDVWYGWYADAEGENYIGDKVELAAGESIWLNCPTAGWTLNWPSAFNPDSNAEERAK